MSMLLLRMIEDYTHIKRPIGADTRQREDQVLSVAHRQHMPVVHRARAHNRQWQGVAGIHVNDH